LPSLESLMFLRFRFRPKGKKASVTRKVPFLQGAFVPPITPFKNGTVDYELNAKPIEWQLGEGSHGFLVNATRGEPTTLSLEQKARLIETAVKTSVRRRPVVADDLASAGALTRDPHALMATTSFDASPIPVKYMMKRLDVVPANEHRLPMAPGAPDPEKRLDGVLKRAGLI